MKNVDVHAKKGLCLRSAFMMVIVFLLACRTPINVSGRNMNLIRVRRSA